MRNKQRVMLGVLGVIAVTGAGCSGGNGTAADTSPQVEERTFALDLASTPLRLDFLTAELTELSVVERVRKGSREVVAAPTLRGMLKVKNTSSDRTARLVGGAVEYLDADGDPIALAPGRGDAAFTFYSYSGERVDPGKDTTQTIDVPFPVAALNGDEFAEMRLRLTYIPTPYRTDAATVTATLVARDQSGERR
jgi:hypothetical protein